ncbi:MAG: holo-ACP synthase [Clostridia bacterium]|nr:holo-ACP synthase [Clostridia bacterium]
MVGIDLVEVERVSLDETFLNKIAHESEIEYVNKSSCDKLKKQRVAALFCVKEAVMKALGMGEGSGVVFKDIQLFHEESGKPYVKLYGKALEKFESVFVGKKIEVSLSHTLNYATAIAILV